MKAKIRKTGEIVDVYHETQHGTPKIIYKESVFVNSRIWTEDELELLTNDNNEHWQDVLERAAIAILQGIISNEGYTTDHRMRGFTRKQQVEAAINYANLLVEELKKK